MSLKDALEHLFGALPWRVDSHDDVVSDDGFTVLESIDKDADDAAALAAINALYDEIPGRPRVDVMRGDLPHATVSTVYGDDPAKPLRASIEVDHGGDVVRLAYDAEAADELHAVTVSDSVDDATIAVGAAHLRAFGRLMDALGID